MQEQPKIQQIFVNVYRTTDRLMVAAPMPGMEPENIVVQVTEDGRLILEGESRAPKECEGAAAQRMDRRCLPS
jgi:HSP20 family protein